MNGLQPRTALLAWFEIEPAVRAEHDRWYLHEHMPERLGVPGFVRGRRYGNGNRVFVIYETAGLNVLTSPAYLARLDAPTPATRRLAHTARGAVRIAARSVYSSGSGCGGWVATAQLRDVRDPERIALPSERALDNNPGLVAVHLFHAIDEVTASKEGTAEASVAPESRRIPWALVVEGAEDVEASTNALLAALGDECAAGPTELMRFQFGLTPDEVRDRHDGGAICIRPTCDWPAV